MSWSLDEQCSLPVLQAGVSRPNVAGVDAEGREAIEAEPNCKHTNEFVGLTLSEKTSCDDGGMKVGRLGRNDRNPCSWTDHLYLINRWGKLTG